MTVALRVLGVVLLVGGIFGLALLSIQPPKEK